MYESVNVCCFNPERQVAYLSLGDGGVIEHIFHLAVFCKLSHLSPEANPALLLQLNSHLRLEGYNCRSDMMMVNTQISLNEGIEC